LCSLTALTVAQIESSADDDRLAPVIDRIRVLLRRDRLCLDIVRYLVSRKRAADSAAGIAAWWVHADATATEAALAKLVAHGAVRAHDVGAAAVYGYTKNPALRRGIARCVKDLEASRARGDR
jgi:hypothetical protein